MPQPGLRHPDRREPPEATRGEGDDLVQRLHRARWVACARPAASAPGRVRFDWSHHQASRARRRGAECRAPVRFGRHCTLCIGSTRPGMPREEGGPVSSGGKDRGGREARERARVYQARLAFHDGRKHRRTRDNVIAGIAGGVLIVAIVAVQTLYFTAGPGAPSPAPSTTSTPSETPAPSGTPTPAVSDTPTPEPSATE